MIKSNARYFRYREDELDIATIIIAGCDRVFFDLCYHDELRPVHMDWTVKDFLNTWTLQTELNVALA